MNNGRDFDAFVAEAFERPSGQRFKIGLGKVTAFDTGLIRRDHD